jgi:hypothetical protein
MPVLRLKGRALGGRLLVELGGGLKSAGFAKEGTNPFKE